MLLTLTLLVIAVLLIPPLFAPVDTSAIGATTLDVLEKVIEYRRTILAVIVTAFGAWVGAGAAYFFGRENLREATNAILQSRGKTAMEKLRETSVREIPPLPLDWRPRTTSKLWEIEEVLCDKPDFWFIPVFEKDDLKAVLDEEVLWRYLASECKEEAKSPTPEASGEAKPEGQNKAEEAPHKKTADGTTEGKQGQSSKKGKLDEMLSGLVDYAKGDPDRAKAFLDIFVSCTMEESAADVYRRMQMEGRDVRLAIVKDNAGKATHFFTTIQVRRMLLDIV